MMFFLVCIKVIIKYRYLFFLNCKYLNSVVCVFFYFFLLVSFLNMNDLDDKKWDLC